MEGAQEEGNKCRSVNLQEARKGKLFLPRRWTAEKVIDVQAKADGETFGRQTHSDNKVEIKIILQE